MLRMLRRLVKRATIWFSDMPEQHLFEPAISIRPDDGRLGVMRCAKCGYCCYAEDVNGEHPLCVPRPHDWQPIKVFQWDNIMIANKLPQAQRCTLCGANATTRSEMDKLGCPGYKREED